MGGRPCIGHAEIPSPAARPGPSARRNYADTCACGLKSIAAWAAHRPSLLAKSLKREPRCRILLLGQGARKGFILRTQQRCWFRGRLLNRYRHYCASEHTTKGAA